ncbi:CAP domain-containing protein [Cellulomonas sp. McL0617]|uniref:CAP domain-containing protein n=1 Tax=Cellulomonas sp. McL0617 TaxID=3415675 RepID=UPI003CFAA7E1
MARDTEKRIDTVPTPRAPGADVTVPGASPLVLANVAAEGNESAERAGATTTTPRRGPAARRPSSAPSVGLPAHSAVEVPQQAPAPSPLVTSNPVVPPVAAPRPRRVRRAVWIGTAAAVVVALGSGSAVYARQSSDRQAQDAAISASIRVDGSVLAAQRDEAADQDAELAVATAALVANRARTAAQAQAVVNQANAVLAAAPNAGDGPRNALAAASSSLAASIVAPATSAASLHRLAAAVAPAQQAAIAGQAAWQAAENARIAAEQAAAAAAAQAQAQAAAAAAARAQAKAAPRAARTVAPRTSTRAAAAPAGGAPSGVPAGGLVCAGSGGSGAGESSVGAIGAAINAYRAGLGLPQLAVVRSGTLVAHSITMANTGGIWHSGSDNIVGCVSNGSASTLVNAWHNSPPHDAQMRRTDVSTMNVGGASLGGWLFGAVKFS